MAVGAVNCISFTWHLTVCNQESNCALVMSHHKSLFNAQIQGAGIAALGCEFMIVMLLLSAFVGSKRMTC